MCAELLPAAAAPPCAQATLAAANVAATLQGLPVYNGPDVTPFIDNPIPQLPKVAPSIVNAKELGLKIAGL